MRRNKLPTQHTCVQVTQNLLCVTGEVKIDVLMMTKKGNRLLKSDFFSYKTYSLDNTLLIHDVGFEAQHSKHHQSGQDGRDEVDDGNQSCVEVAVVVPLVVAGERDDASEAQAEGEEDLRRCFPPHLRLQHLLQLVRRGSDKIIDHYRP